MSKFSSDYWAQFRSPEEEYNDDLIAELERQHEAGDHDGWRCRDCNLCNVRVEDEVNL